MDRHWPWYAWGLAALILELGAVTTKRWATLTETLGDLTRSSWGKLVWESGLAALDRHVQESW